MNRSESISEPSTSISMLDRAREGDGDSWRQLAGVYGPIVYGWARRCGCQAADAADVMQDTLVAVANSIGRYDHERNNATFRGWLWTITRNKIRDRYRDDDARAVGGTAALLAMENVATQNSATQPDEDSSLCEPPTDAKNDTIAARRRMLEYLRDKFDPRSWRMFWETAIEGRQPVDVADEMSVSRWAVYKARARVLQRLQQEMSGLE